MVNLVPGHACKICTGPVPPHAARRGRRRPRRLCLDPECSLKHLRRIAPRPRPADPDAPTACVVCDGPLPLSARQNRSRVICDRPECRESVSAYARQLARRVNARAHEERIRNGPPPTRHCRRCDRDLPLDDENFQPLRVKAGFGYDYWCRPCRNAYKTQRKNLARDQKRRVERLRARPARRVVALPLAYAIHAWFDRYEHYVDYDGGIDKETICQETFGVWYRRVRAWMSSEAQLAKTDVADRVILGLEVGWYDVYDPADWPRGSFSVTPGRDVLAAIDAALGAQRTFEGLDALEAVHGVAYDA